MNVFDLPAYFDREYYESQYNIHVAKDGHNTGPQAQYWINAYKDNAVSYAWCKVYYGSISQVGWKEAFKLADEHVKQLEKEIKFK